MLTENFEDLSIEALEKRKRLSMIAIMTSVIGCSTAISAAFFKFNSGHDFPTLTSLVAIFVLLVTLFVVFDLRKLSRIIGRRKAGINPL